MGGFVGSMLIFQGVSVSPPKCVTSLWLNQPIWIIWFKLDHFPTQVRVKIKHIWNHHLGNFMVPISTHLKSSCGWFPYHLTVVMIQGPPRPPTPAYLSTQASGDRRLARQAELNEEVEQLRLQRHSHGQKVLRNIGWIKGQNASGSNFRRNKPSCQSREL